MGVLSIFNANYDLINVLGSFSKDLLLFLGTAKKNVVI